MDSIEDYNPDKHENDKRYWELAKRVYALEEKIAKIDKPNEDGETKMKCDTGASGDTTDKWVLDQLTAISGYLKLIIDDVKRCGTINKHAEGAINGINKVLDNMTTTSNTNHSEKDFFGGTLSSSRVGVVNDVHIRTVDDFDWEMDEKGSFVFSDLADPNDGLRTEGLGDPVNAKVDTSKLVKAMGPTIVNPIGREYSYCIDGDRLEYIIHLMVRQDYHPTAIRYDDRGVSLVFSKNDNTMVAKTLHLDKL